MRTTSFVDCSKVSLPDYERTLCPPEPLGHRRDPTDYGWHEEWYRLPPGVSTDEALHDFAVRAIEAQAVDYARTVARDVAPTFWPHRTDAYEYDDVAYLPGPLLLALLAVALAGLVVPAPAAASGDRPGAGRRRSGLDPAARWPLVLTAARRGARRRPGGRRPGTFGRP